MLLQRGCTWLTLMPLLFSLSTGELSFYRDALPETSEDAALKHLARYLETRLQQQRLHQSHLPTFLWPMHKKHNNLDRQEERFLKFLAERQITLDDLKQFLVKNFLAHHYRVNHNPIADQISDREPEYLSYYNSDLKRLAYPEEKQPNENDDRFPKNIRQIFDEDRELSSRDIDFILDIFRDKSDLNGMGTLHYERGREAVPMRPATAASEPKFTFKFDDSNLKEKHPFAVKPNDPRYYGEAPFSSDDLDWQDASRVNWKEEETADKERILMKHEHDLRNQETPQDLTARLDVSEPERSAGRHPVIVPVNHDFNNDIYFIAIVAGCSAAAMFALVLISLTWCRLQRGAKAAADIEYPAYGVTGPNKDVSPSGDQRLAQSAQMYHFQHQKQQIIAMENRTSATRDPGSLSEAESDEENEEGDYTVYECPGLASTGEMEVKNPMFHDDPTPATPAAQNNKKEDHI
ncbi:PREDICTED: uncharacterized protein LOC105561260 isoform X2 [Vollenhovia emeryi]|uniref:uncharacterized protein LOC105561260 isoform X2 n=1 Tax=Vollenhovia emeryi TaxID=411798 RepID=UPI0005F52310|nr:PREDICTED: uncharacterized protein LOC105561260 isoform X2 [Vollenhovia emeryi]